jgi:hypothetical protein
MTLAFQRPERNSQILDKELARLAACAALKKFVEALETRQARIDAQISLNASHQSRTLH